MGSEAGIAEIRRTGGWDNGLSPNEFSGTVCLVTGAAQGIGATIAKTFAELGGRVVMSDINAAKVAGSAERLRTAGFEVTGLALDVRDSIAIDAAFAEIENRWGSVGVLVNNAGVGRIGQSEDLSDADWDLHIDVMLSGTFKMSRRAASPMLERGSGAMINLCSIGGFGGNPQRAAYNSAKAGIRILTEVLATEWAARGVRVNAIAPAVTRTAMLQEILDRAGGEILLEDYEGRTPLGRIAETQEMADVVAFLASPRASYITGQILAVDGGWLASDGFATSDGAEG